MPPKRSAEAGTNGLAKASSPSIKYYKGEVAPRKDTEEDDFSTVQLQRVTVQAMVLIYTGPINIQGVGLCSLANKK